MRAIQAFKSLWADRSGVTAVEYGLIAAGVAVALIAVVGPLGTAIAGKFTALTAGL